MKKSITVLVLVCCIISCTKKMSPAKTTVVPPVEAAAATTTAANNMAMVTVGQTVYVAKCGKCHGLKDPANYTQERWVELVNIMAPKAKATDEEKGQIMAYVQHNAKDAVK